MGISPDVVGPCKKIGVPEGVYLGRALFVFQPRNHESHGPMRQNFENNPFWIP